MRYKIVYLFSIILFLFTGCATKITVKSLKPIINSNKIIELKDTNSYIKLSDIKKFPKNSSKYIIKAKTYKIDKIKKIKLREYIITNPAIIYKNGKECCYRYNTGYLYLGDRAPSDNIQLLDIPIERTYGLSLRWMSSRFYISSKDHNITALSFDSYDCITDGKTLMKKIKNKSLLCNKGSFNFDALFLGSYFSNTLSRYWSCIPSLSGNPFTKYSIKCYDDYFSQILKNVKNTDELKKEIFKFNQIAKLSGVSANCRGITIEECDKRLKDKEHMFHIKETTQKTPIKVDQIRLEGVPSWMNYNIKNFKDGTILITLNINDKGKSFFKNDAKRYGISKEYIYLIDKYTDKKIIPIRIKATDAKPVDIKIAYYDGERLYAKIKRLKSLGYGFIKFTSNQKNVDIFVDGLKMGKITKKPFVAKIVEGKHIITAKKYLFGSKSIEVKIKPNDAFSYHFELLPSGNMNELVGNGKIVQSTGTLTVLTSRNDLEVNIDGAIRIPPFKLPNMATGEYTIKVKGPGIKKSIKIEVLPNKNNVYNLDKLIF